jgi:hypothetical protein
MSTAWWTRWPGDRDVPRAALVEEETFLECYRRLGDKPFKAAVYKEARRDDDSEQAVALRSPRCA